ncbi:hypothetical protein [Flavobacterium sp. UBA7682]|uniref:hypothetical protein n=1 Tax=Flavobacterium sp. UBA7682 TaxID=1946560 RepID=UPI0025C24F2F|nr:hypothetical protein [Flavobacterium sp. UBA7682]
MLKIDVLKSNDSFTIKSYDESSDFFLKLFKIVDKEQIASFYFKDKTNFVKFDFAYDFLSIYDFLESLIKYVNSSDYNNAYILLLYERGDDKFIFNLNDNQMITSKFVCNDNVIENVYSIEIFKDHIVELINKINDIVTLFNLTELNYSHYIKWRNDFMQNV